MNSEEVRFLASSTWVVIGASALILSVRFGILSTLCAEFRVELHLLRIKLYEAACRNLVATTDPAFRRLDANLRSMYALARNMTLLGVAVDLSRTSKESILRSMTSWRDQLGRVKTHEGRAVLRHARDHSSRAMTGYLLVTSPIGWVVMAIFVVPEFLSRLRGTVASVLRSPQFRTLPALASSLTMLASQSVESTRTRLLPSTSRVQVEVELRRFAAS